MSVTLLYSKSMRRSSRSSTNFLLFFFLNSQRKNLGNGRKSIHREDLALNRRVGFIETHQEMHSILKHIHIKRIRKPRSNNVVIVMSSSMICMTQSRRLKIEYLDLYLIHWPINVKPGDWETPYTKDLISAFNLTGVWKQMEECKKLGLAKSIGVSNFTCKKLKDLLSFATIPPSVNQKLKEFCDEKGIIITAFSPLGAKGASWGSNVVMDSEILKEIAKAHGRTIAQVTILTFFHVELVEFIFSFL
ncbi:Deoxymugineic acid synthase 1-D [Glycine soja]